jgi:hypothetical protein
MKTDFTIQIFKHYPNAASDLLDGDAHPSSKRGIYPKTAVGTVFA